MRWLRAIVTLVAVAYCSITRGDEIDVQLLARLQGEACRAWASSIDEVLQKDSERRIEGHHRGRPRKFLWLNFPDEKCRLVSCEYTRSSEVCGSNPKYDFQVLRATDERPEFELLALQRDVHAGDVFDEMQAVIPDVLWFGHPLYELFDSKAFRITKAKWVAGSGNGLAEIRAVSIADVQYQPGEPRRVFSKMLRKGVEMQVFVDAANGWKLQNAVCSTPGWILHQTVQQNQPGQQAVEYTVYRDERGGAQLDPKMGDKYTVTTVPPRPFEPEQFYLPHYGLSETTANFLLPSRGYIWTFCVLFVGAIGFRLLAHWLKKKQRKIAS